MRKLSLVLTLGPLVLGATIGVGSAQAQLDPSFGQGGTAAVDLPGSVQAMGAASDGSSYVLTDSWKCAAECEVSYSLFRYTSDARLDAGFGGPTGVSEPRADQEARMSLAVDSQGLPLLAETGREGIVIRRFTESGAPDPTFGADGVVELKCGCLYSPSRILPTATGGLTVLESGSSSLGVLRVFRLRADGSADPRFGKRGVAGFSLPHAESVTTAAASQRGAIYFAGPVCCHFSKTLYLARIAARGKLDTRFLSTARHSLNSIGKFRKSRTTINAVVPRPGGKIDLLGFTARSKGFLLRLNPDGHRDRGFGRGGLRMLPFPVVSADLGSDGAVLAVTDTNRPAGGAVLRILPSGRIDPTFTPRQIPGSAGDTGMSIVHLSGRSSLLLDLGLHECRTLPCAYDPKLIRYLEPAP